MLKKKNSFFSRKEIKIEGALEEEIGIQILLILIIEKRSRQIHRF